MAAVSTDMFEKVVELKSNHGKKGNRMKLRFTGATRLLMNEFLIQNITYPVDILHDYESDEYKQARSTLDRSYPWGRNEAPKPIASINATIGADLLVEFDSIEVLPDGQQVV